MTTEYVAPGFFIEAQFVHGLKPIVIQELRNRLRRKLILLDGGDPEAIRFQVPEHLDALKHIRSVTAFYLGCHYAIPRPKALLSHQHFQQLLKQIERARHAFRCQPFRSFRIHAAGCDSTTFRRITQQLACATGLVDDPRDGEMAIRVFPAQEAPNHWTVLCRLTPRPLSARAWRVVDTPGALNATIAAAMMFLSRPRPTDRFLNLMCGSGTLAIERLLIARARVAVGCDTSTSALAAAGQNLHAAGLTGQIRLADEDATQLPYPSQSFDVLAADLPWGQLIGDHAKNVLLYPLLLQEAARVAVPKARFVLITTEVRLLEETLHRQADLWQLCQSTKLAFKNVQPRIYLLERTKFVTGN